MSLYGVASLLFLGLAVVVALIDKNDGTPLRRVPGLTASSGTLAMTFLYATLFALGGGEEGQHDLILRIVISGGILYSLVFYCVSVCMGHHWATSLQAVILVLGAWLVLLAENLIIDGSHGFSVFAYVFHLLLVCLAVNKLFSYAHSRSKDAQLAKVLLFISMVAYELVWAFVVTSNLLEDASRRASAFVVLDLLLFPAIFVQHLYLPLRAYKTIC